MSLVATKQIGDEWAGPVPASWPVAKTRHVAAIYAGGTPDKSNEGYWIDGTVPWLASGEVNQVDITTPTTYITEDALKSSSAKWVPEDAVIVALAGQGKTKGMTAYMRLFATCNQSLAALVAKRIVHPRFLFWWFSAHYSTLRNLAGGELRDGLNLDLLADVPCPVPPLITQRAIAAYLDRETARINGLIAAKRRMVGLLEERWQGVLEATIQALAANFGDVRLKYVCSEVVVGIVITPSAWYADSGVPAIRGTNVSAGAISLDDLVYLTPEGHTLHPKSRLRSGDVVVVRTGQAGAAAVVPPELEGVNCIDLVIIRLSRNYSPYFLAYVLNSDWMQKHVDEHSVGTIQSHFNVGAASIVPVPRAPRVDQDATVAELDAERRRMTGMRDVLSRQVELLQERRQALVTAAVTGQLDIPEAA